MLLNKIQKQAISIHSPRRRGDPVGVNKFSGSTISIHSPRRRGDDASGPMLAGIRYFNPLPSQEGRQRTLNISGLK